MYHSLLTRRYLTRKIMPLLAACAVMLCTAMVLIVWSVMGGFLATLVGSGKSVIGDVAVMWPVAGFAHYEDLVERLEEEDAVLAACPVVETFGMVTTPNGQTHTVHIKGVYGESFARVTEFADKIWWRPLDKPMRKDTQRADPRLHEKDQFGYAYNWEDLLQQGLTLTEPSPDGADRGAAVPGIELMDSHFREPWGGYIPGAPRLALADGNEGGVFVYPWDDDLVISIPRLDSQGQPVDVTTFRVPVANEFRTGMFDADNGVVIVRFDVVQKALAMDEASRIVGDTDTFEVIIDPETGEETFPEPRVETDPARATSVLVRGADGVALADLRAVVQRVYGRFAIDYVNEVPDADVIRIRTWEELNSTMIAAVKKETALVLFLFLLISVVAVFLVLAIFWSMVAEKTKDIGILRSLGAGRGGVAWVWLRYGAAIGLVGAALGGVLAYLIVWNINPIHEWLGSALGIYVWDPKIYYFTEIPNEVDPTRAVIVMVGGLASSVIGALVPALRAAWMDPVRALRFE